MKQKQYMLDTNMVSYLFKQHPQVMHRVSTAPISALCISAITEGELRFGLAKRPQAHQLHEAVREFLRHVDVLVWDSVVAARYGSVRAEQERQGRVLAPLDLLIAAHALAAGAVLVTHDAAFGYVKGLVLEDWTR